MNGNYYLVSGIVNYSLLKLLYAKKNLRKLCSDNAAVPCFALFFNHLYSKINA
jgi:hypothetical protein